MAFLIACIWKDRSFSSRSAELPSAPSCWKRFRSLAIPDPEQEGSSNTDRTRRALSSSTDRVRKSWVCREE